MLQRTLIRIFKWLIALVGISVTLLLIAVAFLPLNKIAESEVRNWLIAQNIPVEFTWKAINLRGLELKNLGFENSEDATIDSLVISYTPRSLWNRRASSLKADGLNIVLRQLPDGSVHLVPTDSLVKRFAEAGATKQGFVLPALPFEEVNLTDALLTYFPLQGEPVKVVFSASVKADYSGVIRILGAHVPLADGSKLEVTDLILERENLDLPFTFSISRIAHNTKDKAFFTPMHALGEVTLTRENSFAEGIIVTSDLLDRWQLNLKGKADMRTGAWNLRMDQPPVVFESGILQPDQLFPFLRGLMKDATGSFALTGELHQPAGEKMSSAGEFRFDDINLTVKNTPIKKANGRIAFSSLVPMITKGQQTVDVGEITIGLPLSHGQLKFSLDATGKVILAPSTWDWAGGKLRTSRLTTDAKTLAIERLTLSAQNLAVEQLLASFLKDGFSATGMLNGELPIVFKNGKALIRKGRLATPGGGAIRYVPAAENTALQKGQSFQTDLLLSAVEDFHYEELTLDINSKDERIMEVLLHLRGRNPQLYDGKLVELNINLTGNILEAVQSTMDIYSLPERLEEQLAP